MSRARFLIPVALLAFLVTGCGSNQINTKLGKEFSLHTGQIAYISSENLSINFKEVSGDSRCPTGVTCIWAGQVSCNLEIKLTRDHTQKSQLVIIQSGASDSSKQVFENYMFSYSVDPYPVAGKPILQKEYVLHLTVTNQ
jgi:hypothetical protein